MVTDPAAPAGGPRDKAKKYPRQRVSDKSTMYLFAVSP